MPRVGGNGPFRGARVLSNSSGDEAEGPAVDPARTPPAAAWGAANRNAQGGADQGTAASALFEAYLEAGRAAGDDLVKDQVFEAGLNRVRDHLSNVDSSCCLICLNHIRPTEAVWHCGRGCFSVLHLVCIQEWARSQLDAAGAKAAARLSQFPAAAEEARASAEWGCPKCRTTYPAADIPRQYVCFCGKATNPEFDPWIAPHSCGEVCGRPLPGGCGHTCLLLCHPGPCPPCPLLVDAECYCGARAVKRRCGHHEYSCGGPCGARLECGHICPDVCHPGDCTPCEVPGVFACRCGAEKRRLACGQRHFQCTRVCGRRLGCGNHTCQEVCHAGPCAPCPLSGARTCPCGKVTHAGASCADRVPTCGATCGKLLPCGVHTCADRCHYGDCTAQCRGPALKTCRCGKSQKETLCFQDFTCERRCAAMRACGRHPCKRRCCDGNCPPCEEVCNRKLKCGNHRCPAPCHSGPCRPCPLTSTVQCACGAASCTLPCGAEARAEPPRCAVPCRVPRICRHGPQLPPHRCHYGPCPPCPLPCATPLTCGHACGVAACHDPPPPPVPDFLPPAVPKAGLAGGMAAAELRAGRREVVPGDVGATAPAVQQPTLLAARMLAATAASGQLPSACPPCGAVLQVACVGAHGTRPVACSLAAPYSCGAPCGRPLACGNHACALACHAVGEAEGAAAGPLAPRPCRQCDRRCERRRGCGHACPLACHTGPCPACQVPGRAACRCGKATVSLPCHELAAAAANPADPAMSCGKPCHKQLLYCPHPCKALCHAGPCPAPEACAAEVSVRCACPAKRRAKWSCAEVQAELVRLGRPRTYDDAQAPRLLPCDASCEAQRAKAAKAAPAADVAAPKVSMVASTSTGSLADAAAAGEGGGAGGGGGKGGRAARLSRAEREEQAARREVERARQARLRAVFRGVALGVVVLLGVGLALAAQRLLMRVDASLRDRYAPEAL